MHRDTKLSWWPSQCSATLTTWSTPTSSWSSAQRSSSGTGYRHTLRSVQDSESWLVSQLDGAFFKHLVDTLEVPSSLASLQRCGIDCGICRPLRRASSVRCKSLERTTWRQCLAGGGGGGLGDCVAEASAMHVCSRRLADPIRWSSWGRTASASHPRSVSQRPGGLRVRQERRL